MGLNSDEITAESASAPSAPLTCCSVVAAVFDQGQAGALSVAHPVCMTRQTSAAAQRRWPAGWINECVGTVGMVLVAVVT